MKNIPEVFVKLINKWRNTSPYFYVFGLYTTYIEESTVPTIGITCDIKSTNIKIYYNNEWLPQFKDQELLGGILLHEFLHIINLSVGRGMNKENRTVWNQATDMCINEEIREFSFGGVKYKLPNESCFIEQAREKGYKGEIVSEEIYRFLLEDQKKNKGKGKGKESDLKSHDNHDGLNNIANSSSTDKEIVESIVKALHKKAKAYNEIHAGNSTNSYIDKIEGMLNKSKKNWSKVLRKAVNPYSHGSSSFRKLTWMKKSRRCAVLPGKQKLENKINIYVDTSGSVSNRGLKTFFTEIEKIADSSKINLIQWDTEIQSVRKYKKGMWKKLEIQGRGGTCITSIFNYFKINPKMKKGMHLILTDGGLFESPFSLGVKNIAWVVIDNKEFRWLNDRIIHIKTGEN